MFLITTVKKKFNVTNFLATLKNSDLNFTANFHNILGCVNLYICTLEKYSLLKTKNNSS